jgi:hypothetical protein
MTIPYLPGWWDQLAPSATKFVDSAQHALAPNFYANKKFEEMVQQNPLILDQLSNLNPEQRGAFAKSLGYTTPDNSPIANLPEGETLKERKLKAKAMETLSPDQQNQMFSKIFGVSTQEEIAQGRKEAGQKDTIFGQTVGINNQNKKLNEFKIKAGELETKEAEYTDLINNQIRVKYPSANINVKTTLNDMLSGKPNSEVLQAIRLDKGLSTAFDQLYNLYKDRLGYQAQYGIASMKNPAEKAYGVKYIQDAVDNSFNIITMLKDRLNKITLGQEIASPETKDQLEQQLKSEVDNHTTLSKAFNTSIKETFGKTIPGAIGVLSNTEAGVSGTNPTQSLKLPIKPDASSVSQINPKTVEAILTGIAAKKVTLEQIKNDPRVPPADKAEVERRIMAGGK